MHKRALTAALCILLTTAAPCFAASKASLEATQAEIKQSKKRQQELSKKEARIKNELQSLQQQLVRSVAAVQKNERALLDTEAKLAETEREQAKKQRQIEKNEKRLESLIAVALRFSRMPPEAMVMSPENSKQTLRVSKALSMISNDIKNETQQLNEQKRELLNLTVTLQKQRRSREAQQKTLERERRSLDAKVKERRRLYASLQQDQKTEAKKAQALAKKATDMQQLIKKLESERRVLVDSSAPASSAYRGKLRSFKAAKGRIRMPATGVLKESFGAQNNAGSASKGITIATAPSAQVVAPYDGEVIFAGRFLNYGRMTILRHSDQYLTLLAGFSDLNVQTGEFLLEGEPIGAMGIKTQQRQLYVELREKDQPVNPSGWIKGL